LIGETERVSDEVEDEEGNDKDCAAREEVTETDDDENADCTAGEEVTEVDEGRAEAEEGDSS